jgi:type I restriction enzyme, R subunit
MATVTALAEKIREATAPEKADVTEVLRRIGEVPDRSVEDADIPRDGPPAIDLSRIDFKARGTGRQSGAGIEPAGARTWKRFS